MTEFDKTLQTIRNLLKDYGPLLQADADGCIILFKNLMQQPNDVRAEHEDHKHEQVETRLQRLNEVFGSDNSLQEIEKKFLVEVNLRSRFTSGAKRPYALYVSTYHNTGR